MRIADMSGGGILDVLFLKVSDRILGWLNRASGMFDAGQVKFNEGDDGPIDDPVLSCVGGVAPDGEDYYDDTVIEPDWEQPDDVEIRSCVGTVLGGWTAADASLHELLHVNVASDSMYSQPNPHPQDLQVTYRTNAGVLLVPSYGSILTRVLANDPDFDPHGSDTGFLHSAQRKDKQAPGGGDRPPNRNPNIFHGTAAGVNKRTHLQMMPEGELSPAAEQQAQEHTGQKCKRPCHSALSVTDQLPPTKASNNTSSSTHGAKSPSFNKVFPKARSRDADCAVYSTSEDDSERAVYSGSERGSQEELPPLMRLATRVPQAQAPECALVSSSDDEYSYTYSAAEKPWSGDTGGSSEGKEAAKEGKPRQPWAHEGAFYSSGEEEGEDNYSISFKRP
ncbi:hypothetical protein B0I35DRAFT_474266 [Stachybotrys elegans]|uniref:Uncharacterized protein n=1 Tax=Stachybotrys elegans TaxID=80388 RepID=A0A8K0WYN4_9HYPO|nr:hypothetical protein B0I35DRAFT_474266 [Stachybotrys elegans]